MAGTIVLPAGAQTPPPQYHIPAPTIVDVVQRQAPFAALPVITGVTFNHTLVDVYIDDVFYGKATVQDHESGVASFSYVPFLPLSVGQHTIKAVARSLDQSVRSAESAFVTVLIEDVVLAPTLQDATVDSDGRTMINGLIGNDHTVEIYINDVLHASFVPPTSKSGITSFWYKPNLANGEYTVTARAVTPAGSVSDFATQQLVVDTSVVADVEPTTPEAGTQENTNTDNEQSMHEQETETEMTEPEHQADVPVITTPEDLEALLETSDPVVVEPTEPETPVVMVDTEQEGDVVIAEPEDQSELALGDVQSDMVIESGEGSEAMEEKEDDEPVIFGADDEQIDEGVAEERINDIDEDIQERNRTTGFVILLVIAIILAIWYVREKRQAERERVSGDAIDQDDDNLLNN